MIRVAICDDHPIVRSGLRAVLGATGDMNVVGEATDHGSLRRLLANKPCDVLLLDVELPGRTGLDILELVHAEHKSVRVLVLSIYPEDQYALRALRSGAQGYLNKSSASDNLVEAIRLVAQGKRYITAGVSSLLAEAVAGNSERPPHDSLSARELQVMRLIAGGKRLSEIASDIALSPKTVSVYRARILEKMNLRSNVALAHYAQKYGLL